MGLRRRRHRCRTNPARGSTYHYDHDNHDDGSDYDDHGSDDHDEHNHDDHDHGPYHHDHDDSGYNDDGSGYHHDGPGHDDDGSGNDIDYNFDGANPGPTGGRGGSACSANRCCTDIHRLTCAYGVITVRMPPSKLSS